MQENKEYIFVAGNLEYLSASILYTSGPPSFKDFPLFGNISSLPSSPLRDSIPELKFTRESFRFDSHEPLGDHLNHEVWLELKGKKKGRSLLLSNTHIRLGDDDD